MFSTHSIATSEKTLSDRIKSALAAITRIEGWKFKQNIAYIVTSETIANSAFKSIEDIAAIATMAAKGATQVRLHKDNNISYQKLEHDGLTIERGQAITKNNKNNKKNRDNKNNKMVSVKGISEGAENLFKLLDTMSAMPDDEKDKKSDSGESASIDNSIILRVFGEQTLDKKTRFIDYGPYDKKSLSDEMAKFPDAWEFKVRNSEYMFVPTRLIKAALQNESTSGKKSSKNTRVVILQQRFPLYASEGEFLEDLFNKLTHLAGGVDYNWTELLDKRSQEVSYLAMMDRKALAAFKSTCKKYNLATYESDNDEILESGMYMGIVKRCDVYEKLMLKEKVFSSSLSIFNHNLAGNGVQTAGGATRAVDNSPSTTIASIRSVKSKR